LFQVIVLPVGGVPFQRIGSATGRAEKQPKISCPLIRKEVEVVVFFLDIDYDDATW